MTLPATMRAVQLAAYDGRPESLSVAELPMPQPGAGQVLVKVAASPINPSDVMFLRGMYGFKKPLPATPGFEGSGTVVSTGGGMLAKLLRGKRVACAAADPQSYGGTWAEYVAVSAQMCVPLRKEVSLEQGAMMLVNPLTAWALVEEAHRGHHRAVVQTAAASALGRMILRLARKFSLPVINVVRRREQVELLQKLGAEYVLDSSDADFDARLRELARRMRATLAFDAVAGEMSMRVLRALPPRGRIIVYGALSLGPAQADPGSLIFESKQVEGFWLSGWLRKRGMLARFRTARQVQKLLAAELKSEIRARVPLTAVAQALADYAANMTSGKILVVP